MKLKQILIGGILAGIVIEVISMAFSWLAQSIWNYDVLKLAGMRTINDPVSILFFVYPWVLGFALVCVYSYFEKALEGNYVTKGWKFGLLMWVVVSISSAFLVFVSMDYPIGFTVNSVIGPLIYMLVTGIVVAKIFDWKK
ncbi:MAG: hypothetical protein NTV74_02640 [Euryarchaeota archaeon]|nr:hypothetical protein [Euryarchaeota archaeon]